MILTQTKTIYANVEVNTKTFNGQSTKQFKEISEVVALTIFDDKKAFHDFITDYENFKITSKKNTENSEGVFKSLEKRYMDNGKVFGISRHTTEEEEKKYTANMITHVCIYINTSEIKPSYQLISSMMTRSLSRIYKSDGVEKIDLLLYPKFINNFCKEFDELLTKADKLWAEHKEGN
jgi:hypothetical protein